MSAYIVVFLLGFLTDKIRLFPFILGVVLGIVLKTLLEKTSFSDVHTRAYEQARSFYEHYGAAETPTPTMYK